MALAEWIGEDGNHLNLMPLGAVIGGAAIAAIFLPKKSKGIRKILISCCAIIGAVFVVIACWAVGSSISRRAFNDCIDNADTVVQQLKEFKTKSGEFPTTLAELPCDLPGNRLLRPNILFYKRTDKGFVLEFSDWLVSHSTNESGQWTVTK